MWWRKPGARVVLVSCLLFGCTGVLSSDAERTSDPARPGVSHVEDGGLATEDDAASESEGPLTPDLGDGDASDAASGSADSGAPSDGAPSDTGGGGSEGGPDTGGGGDGGGDEDTGTGEPDDQTGHDGASEPSVEVGRTLWGSDYAQRDDAPAGGTLFSVWTKMPDPGSSYPWLRGNLDVYVLRGANWSLRCLVANSSAESPTDARYSANTMLLVQPGDTWIGDFSYYESGGGYPEAPYRDWVWVAWQVVVASDAFIIRQWLKFGLGGGVFPAGESRLTFAEAREVLVSRGWSPDAANAWRPSDATDFQVGSDRGFLTYARMGAQSAEPTIAELEAIATGQAALSLAWGSYPLVWENGRAALEDQSGHGRDLMLAPGGVLYGGPAGPPL